LQKYNILFTNKNFCRFFNALIPEYPEQDEITVILKIFNKIIVQTALGKKLFAFSKMGIKDSEILKNL